VGATVAREGVEFGVLHREVAVGGQLLTLQGLSGVYEEVFLPLHGVYQASNAACALAAVEAFLGVRTEPGGTAPAGGLDAELVRAALADVDSPGRLEVVRRSPTVLVDAAHNPAGAAVLAEALQESFGFSRLVGVVGVLTDKDAEGILDALEPVLDQVVITRSSSPRSMPTDELGELAEEIFGEDRVHVRRSLPDAVGLAVELAEADGQYGGGVLATGSVTVAADVRAMFGAR
jgi:dihydrofolate synthase/folylpolyglutamate synthase